ncbi:MAG TPA: hypothetical protein VHJ20_13890 [Polyangia bacterium]|nr:hypothetical protein [Polyangia bacterium]
MKRASVVMASLLVAAGVTALGLRESRTQADARASREVAPSNDATSSQNDEVARLRAEVQRKDHIIRDLVANGAVKDETNAALAAEAIQQANDRADPAGRARRLLDERIAATSSSPSAAELSSALAAALSTISLAPARVTEQRCGGTLCRVTLAADSPAAMNASLGALVDHLPKAMGASAIYETEDGARDVYMARTSDALALESRATP